MCVFACVCMCNFSAINTTQEIGLVGVYVSISSWLLNK